MYRLKGDMNYGSKTVMKIVLILFIIYSFPLTSLAQERLGKVKLGNSDYNQKGVKLFFEGNRSESIKNLELAHKKNPGNSEALYNMSGFYLMAKKYEPALKSINRALKISPNDTLYLNRRAKILIGQKRYQKAAEVYKKILSVDPDDKKSYSKLGAMYTLLGQWKNAELNLLKARNLLGDKPAILSSLANAYIMQEKHKVAIDVLSIAQRNNANAEREVSLGIAYEGLGDKQNALEHFYKAKDMGSKNKMLQGHIKRVIYTSPSNKQ